MNTQELHDSIASDLASRGLPVAYADRTAAELADHHRDLVEELRAEGTDEPAANREASSRLGDPRSLVKKSVRAYQRRHWCGRWPLLTFLIGPVVMLAAVWIGTGLLLYGLGTLFGADAQTTHPTTTAQYVGYLLCKSWILFLVPAAVIYWLARTASRAAMSRRWTLLAACVLAMVVGSFQDGSVGSFSNPSRFKDFAGEPLAHDMMIVAWPALPSLSMSAPYSSYASNVAQHCQFLLPMVVAGIFLCVSRNALASGGLKKTRG